MDYLNILINGISAGIRFQLKRPTWKIIVTTHMIVATILLSSCRIGGRVIHEPIPDRDAIFQSCNDQVCEPEQTGFINADGSQLIYLDHTPWNFSEPQWAGVDNSCLLVTHAQGRLSCIDSTGKLSRIRPKESLGNASPIPDKDEIYIIRASDDNKRTELHRISLDTGDFLQTFPSEGGWRIDIGANTQADGVVVYSRTRFDNSNRPHETELTIADIETMSERVLLHYAIQDPVADASILNPAISPDGQWIAYTHTEGIHLIRPDGSGDKLLVNIPDWNEYWPRFTWAPKASWSPDSQWIVYHRCLNRNCTVTDNKGSAIYKMNIETGENELLLHGGINPYWKLVD